MKNIIYFFFFIPLLSFSQFKETAKEQTNTIGQFYDESANAPFSLSKTTSGYNLCFYNKVTMKSESQMICLALNETTQSMTEFYMYVLNFFSDTEIFKSKNIENSQYIITVHKSGNFINLEFHNKFSDIRNNTAITNTFSKENWKMLFGKSP